MKTKLSLLLILISYCFLVSQCSKNSPDQSALLPPVTSTGANTFGCLVDGRAMLPADGVPTFDNPYPPKARELVFGPGDNTVDFNFYNGKAKLPAPYYLDIYFTNFSNLQAGNYSWHQGFYAAENANNVLHQVYGSFYDDDIKNYAWFDSYENSGTTTITRMDTANYIISGTFSGKLRQRNGTKEITITNGRFDIKWHQ